MRFPPKILFAVIPAILSTASAQSPPASGSIIPASPGFEAGTNVSSLWYGADASGAIAGEVRPLPVLGQDGVIRGTPMPVSPAVSDLNADGLPDIAVMDVLGYLKVFFNSGTKEAPKFTRAELSTLFLTRTSANDPALPLPLRDVEWWVANPIRDAARRGPRIFLSDQLGSTRKDLIVGNYSGEILFIPNSGSASAPDFKQPPEVARAIIPTMKDSQKKWGNVFAPAVWDWNRDGRSDLLVGEGSYSANSIHLLINQGSNDRPVFDENNRNVLAYGMGLEQLSPCVVDYNGDGFPDLLVTERSGKVALYLSSPKPWKPGDTLTFDSFLRPGGAAATATGSAPDPMTAATASGLLSLGGIATIAAGDLNGDGLFDLVFGKSNGRVAFALNSGSKTQPKFADPVDLKCETKPLQLVTPAGWECDSGLTRGNFYGFISLVGAAEDPEAKPVEGARCLKAGYFPSPNKIMPAPKLFPPAFAGWDRANAWRMHYDTTFGSPANFFRIRFPDNWSQYKVPLKTKKTYVFSMRVKGSGVTDGIVAISCWVEKDLSEAKLVRGDRGSVALERNRREERKTEVIKFSPGVQWSEIKKEFSIKFDDKELDDITQVDPRWWGLFITFDLAPGAGVLYVDDVRLTEK